MARPADFISSEALQQIQAGGEPTREQLPASNIRPADFMRLQPMPELDNSLVDELGRGAVSGTIGLKTAFFGVTALVGRELDIGSLEKFGIEGVKRGQISQFQLAPEVGSLEDIEDVGDFFKFAAQGIGQALPSLALMVVSGGVGGTIAKKAIETGIKKTIAAEMRKTLAKKGFSKAAADDAIVRAFQSKFASKMLLDGITQGTPNAKLLADAFARGAAQSVLPASALPQIGQIDIELQAAGKNAGLTSLLAGTAAGLLDAIPALRLLGRMFPGISTTVAKNYVKDVAVGAGAQALLEGSTEGVQEMIAIAALAYHDPSFDPTSRENLFRIADSFAIGALVGAVTGAGAEAFGRRDQAPTKVPKPGTKRNIPIYRFEDEAPASLAPDFNPADNTFFQEVRDRVRTSVGQVLNPVFNSVRDKAQSALDALDVDFKGQLNKVGARISNLVDKIQTDFVSAHQTEIDKISRFASESAQSIYENAKQLTDPEAREAFIQRGLAQVQEQVNVLAEKLNKKAELSGQSFNQTVDSFEDLSDLLNKQTQEELTESEPDAFAPVEDTPVRFTFGKDKTGGVQSENNLFAPADPDAAVGWQSKELARRAMIKQKKLFPSVPDSAWSLKQKEDGTWVIEIATAEGNKLLADDARLNEGVESARVSARGNPDPQRPRAKIPSVDRPGKQTTIDLLTLANAGRGLNEQSVTLRQGLITALSRLFDRGGLNREEFNKAVRTYDKAFPQEKAAATKFNIGPQGQDADVRLRPDLSDPVDRQDAARSRELDQAFTDPDAIPIGDEPDATGLENQPSEEQQARQSAAQATVPAPVTQQPGVSVTEKVQQPKVTILASEASQTALGGALKALVERFVKILSKKGTRVTVVETRSRDALDLPQDIKDLTNTLDFLIMEALSPASVHYNLETNEVTIFIHDFTKNIGQTMGLLMHELGHVIHYDTWASLTRVEQDALWLAFKDDVAAGRTTGGALQASVEGFENLIDPNTPAKLSIYEFREWMADQFVLWAAGRSKPVGALKKFVEAVGAKLKQLYDYIQSNPGRLGKLNETFAEFADSVAKRAVGLNPPGLNYFAREGAAGRDMRAIATTALADVEIGNLNDIDALLRKMRDSKDTDIVVSGIARIPAKQKTALEKRLARYPAIARNTEAFNKWVKNAWNLALSPATGVLRRIGERVPVANEIANIFGRNIGKAKTTQNYHDRTTQMKGQFAFRYETMTKGMTALEKEQLAKSLQDLDGTDGKPATLRERQMRKFFDDLLVYIRESGLPVAEVRNYFPRAFNYDLMINDEKKIIAHLQSKHNMSLDNARGFYQSMLSPEMRDWAAVGRQVPAFKNMRSRTLTDPFFKQYQSATLDGVVSNYINSAVKRAEYNRFLGEKAPRGATRADDLKKSTWNPKGKLEAFVAKAKEQGATPEDLKTIDMFIDAQLGMLGRDSKIAQRGRKAMAAMIAYQNMRLLLFTVFASFPDLIGPAIRAGSSVAAFKSLTNNMQELLKSKGAIADMSRAFGIISSEASNHILTEYVDNNFMPPGLRKANEAFFKYTGLNYFTDLTRKMALVVGIDYLKTMARQSTDPNAKSRDRIRAQAALQELGITKEAIDAWVAGGEAVWGSPAYTKTGKDARFDQAVSESLVQFVNESIMRPNASQRPILASHPGAMLVFHLKGFMFAMYEVVGKRLYRNVQLSKTTNEVLDSAIIPVVTILALTMVGLELRELMQYAFTGRTPPTDRMDGYEYVETIIDRSGLLGQSMMAVDGASGDLAFLSGPTLGQLAQFIEHPSRFRIGKATPILSQMPSLRQLL